MAHRDDRGVREVDLVGDDPLPAERGEVLDVAGEVPNEVEDVRRLLDQLPAGLGLAGPPRQRRDLVDPAALDLGEGALVQDVAGALDDVGVAELVADLRQLPTTEVVGLSVDSRSTDTGVSDATAGAFTVMIPDFRAY